MLGDRDTDNLRDNLRDRFAMSALRTAFLVLADSSRDVSAANVVDEAYVMAELMLVRRKQVAA